MIQNNFFLPILKSQATRIKKAKRITETIKLIKSYSWVGLYEVTEKEISIIAWSGSNAPAFSTFPVNKGLNGRVVKYRKTILVNDIINDSDYLITFATTNSEIDVPIFSLKNNEVIGTIDVESKNKNNFKNEDVEFLEGCANYLISFFDTSSITKHRL